LQKRAPGGLVAPQDGQPAASRLPQALQNLLPAGLSKEQAAQIKGRGFSLATVDT